MQTALAWKILWLGQGVHRTFQGAWGGGRGAWGEEEGA